MSGIALISIPMKASRSVLRLLNLFGAIRDLSPFDRLDGDEELLLNDLVLRWSKQDKVMVRDVLADIRYPSSATAYRRLMRLHDKGLVSFQIPHEDRRLRYVLPTEAAKQYISSLEEVVNQLSNEKN